MSESGPERPTAARFPTTRWSRVAAAAGPDASSARVALEDLCRDYWFPLYAFARRRGQSPHEAEDTVQGLLADLLNATAWQGSIGRMGGSAPSFERAATTTWPISATMTGPPNAAEELQLSRSIESTPRTATIASRHTS